jgi:hypothetical protein
MPACAVGAHARNGYDPPMLPRWLDTRKATALGTSLAEDFTLRSEPVKLQKRKRAGATDPQQAHFQALLQKFLLRVDREVRPLRLNLLQRAKLANTFKWGLLDKGIETSVADELTRALVLRVNEGGAPARAGRKS